MIKNVPKVALKRFSTYSIAIFALLIANKAHAYQWQVFGLSKTNDSSIFCSATIVKKGSTCRVLTAAHCLDDQTQKLTLRNHNKAAMAQVSVMTIDRTKDLAWIEPDAKTLKNLCSQIQEIGEEKMFGRDTLYVYYSAYGVLNSGLQKINAVNNIMLAAKALINGHPGLDFTSILKPMNLIRGMSGGALSDDRGQFLGINSQFEPAMDTSYFIPVEEVVKYLNSPSDQRTIGAKGLNRFQDTGGNNHGNSNGGNNHGNGTDNSKAKSWQDSIKEMDEGVVLSDGRVLIGRGGYSIDGLDKWTMTQHMKDPIYREQDGYPNESIRKNIFNRIKGRFQSHAASLNLKFLDILPNDPYIRSNETMNHHITLQIQSSKIEMIFPFGLDLRSPPVSVQWKVQASADYKQITLSNPQSNLTCKNNNYLKLICRNENEELSIAYPDGTMKIDFRWYKKTSPKQVLFMHGALYETR